VGGSTVPTASLSTVVGGKEVYSADSGFRGPPAGRLLLPGEDS
jgi:hypothetical protein